MVRPHKTYLTSFQCLFTNPGKLRPQDGVFLFRKLKKNSKNNFRKEIEYLKCKNYNWISNPFYVVVKINFGAKIQISEEYCWDNFPNLGHLVCMFIKFPKDESFFIRRLISHFWMSRDSIIMDCKQGNHMARDFDNLYHFFSFGCFHSQ